MSSPVSSKPFFNSSNKDQYGKFPLQSWVGKVVSYDAQKEQIEQGWGWRYKVRILGDNSNNDVVEDEELSYALCLLPTTAGSGAAYKLRSVRISQGDMVYGVYGGDGPRIIIGVFPRTRDSFARQGTGKFNTLSGFYGALTNTGILSGEFNEQLGPTTPNTSPIDINKSNRTEADPLPENFGLATPITAEDEPWDGTGNPITTNQIKYIITNGEFTDEKINAVNQGVTQGLIEEDVAKQMIFFLQKKNKRANEEAIKIGFPPPPENTN